MPRFDPRAELAPRDIVARAIDHEMKRLGLDCVYLDISHKPKDFILNHFPNVYATCLKFGYDMSKEPVPVVPAAHYTCGGVMTDQHGRTDVDALYCVGEASYTGLHGANRMASNSLLECIVYGQAAGQDIIARLGETVPDGDPHRDESRVADSDEHVITHNWDDPPLHGTMGIVAPPNACNAPATASNCCCAKSTNTTPFPRHQRSG